MSLSCLPLSLARWVLVPISNECGMVVSIITALPSNIAWSLHSGLACPARSSTNSSSRRRLMLTSRSRGLMQDDALVDAVFPPLWFVSRSLVRCE